MTGERPYPFLGLYRCVSVEGRRATNDFGSLTFCYRLHPLCLDARLSDPSPTVLLARHRDSRGCPLGTGGGGVFTSVNVKPAQDTRWIDSSLCLWTWKGSSAG